MDSAQEVRAWDVLKAVVAKIGAGRLLALRPRQIGTFELTLVDKSQVEVMLDGLLVNGIQCTVRSLNMSDVLVSFPHLPAYITDEDILEKLRLWMVVPLTPIRRRFYPGTDVADGTRYVKVRFPKEVASLPYSTRFVTAEGLQYFWVIHDKQVRLCRLCLRPGHVMKDCLELVCREYCEPGHCTGLCGCKMSYL